MVDTTLVFAETIVDGGWSCVCPLVLNPEYNPDFPEAVNQRRFIHREILSNRSDSNLLELFSEAGSQTFRLSYDLSNTMADTYGSYD